jgi:hypothetical protein
MKTQNNKIVITKKLNLNTMKTLIITIALLGSLLFNSAYAGGRINMNEKLEKTVTFENGVLPLEKNQTDFVKVSFKINNEGKLEILEMNYSDEEIKNLLINKLSEITFNDKQTSKEVYNYNFSFKKL